MKSMLATIHMLTCVLLNSWQAGAEELVVVSSAIREVTVYSDCARVARSGKAVLAKGTALYAFEKLPGWVDESSIRASVAPANAGKIADVQVKRSFLARAGDEEVRKAEAAVQEISDRMAALADETKVLEEQSKHIEAIRVFSLEKLPKDAAVRDVSIENYGNVVKFVADSLRNVAAARREVAVKLRELKPELAARQRKLEDIKEQTRLEEAAILVAVESPGSENATLSLTYVVPGATWTPTHEIRAEAKDPKTALVSSFAVVTQTTGENWDGAHISFSTQSPRETMSIPELNPLRLEVGGQIERTQSFSKAKNLYLSQGKAWNTRLAAQDINDFTQRFQDQQEQGAGNRMKFEQIEKKRGTSHRFVGLSKPVIRTDGRSVRVPIGEIALDTATQIVCVPYVSLNAARILRMTNTGEQAILPGKISLYRAGAFLGVTSCEFVAEAEPFDVFFGVADQIKLARVLDRKQSSLVRGARTRMQVAFEISAENLSDSDVSAVLTDLIPVSESGEIQIYRVRIYPEGEPDSKGILKWTLTLKPKEKRLFRIEYKMEYPAAILEQNANAAPGMPVRDHIMKLEAGF